MLNKLKPKSEFTRNVLTLMTGTTVAQAIPIAVSPILTRIYTPEDFGVYALFIAIVSILGSMAAGRYELAIMLPKKDEDAIHIVALSVIIVFFVSTVLLCVIFIFHSQLVHLLGNPEISFWLYFIPVAIFLTGVYQSFNYWLNRKKCYDILSKNRMIQSGTASMANISLGVKGLGDAGLIMSGFLAQGIVVSWLIRLMYKNYYSLIKSIKIHNVITLAKKYIRFPKFLILAHGMNTFSSQLPVILFSNFFNATVVGHYMIIQRVVGLPTGIISKSISDVFRQRASEEFIHKGNCKESFVDTFKKLVTIAVGPFVIFFWGAPELFGLVFGADWKVAGEYAQILTPMFFLQFVTSPLSGMFMIAEKQQLDLYWQIFLLISVLASVLIGFYVFKDIKSVLILLTVAHSIAYIVNLAMAYDFSKGRL